MSLMAANCMCCGFSLSAEEARYYGGGCEACTQQRHDEIERWRHGAEPAPGIRRLTDAVGLGEPKGSLQ